MTAADALLELATRNGVQPEIDWGMVRVRLTPPFDLPELRRMAAGDGYRVIGSFGTSAIEVELDDQSPPQADLARLADLADTMPAQHEVRASASGWYVAELLLDRLTAVELRYSQPNWCHSVAVFEQLVQSDWLRIADSLQAAPVVIGPTQIDLELVAGTSPSVLVPLEPTGDDAHPDSWPCLMAIADSCAWRNIAIDEVRHDSTVLLALHRDQQPIIEVRPDDASGGVQLLDWLRKTDDGNREEALRHVLRFLTASSKHLPDATAARALSERQRIALSREHAAEVHRAISDGQIRTAGALGDIRRELAQFVEDTSKTAQGSVVASIGVVALVARSSDALPGWLVVLVALGAVTGVAVLVVARWQRLGELASDAEALRLELEHDPLLPTEERAILTRQVTTFDAKRRARGARAEVCVLGAMAVMVIAAATGWLLWGQEESEDPTAEYVVSVEGFVRWEDGVGKICSGLSSENPPECQGETRILRGADPNEFELNDASDAVQVGTSLVRVTGTVDGDILEVHTVTP